LSPDSAYNAIGFDLLEIEGGVRALISYKWGSDSGCAAQDNEERSYRNELVMDAIQDLFVEIWDAKERLAKVRSIKSYLCKSIRRKLIAKAFERRSQLYVNGKEAVENCPSAEWSLIERQTHEWDRKALSLALRNLSHKQQELIHLKYYGGMSYNEIAQIMCLDKKAVYNLMAYTLQVLRQSLKKST
jgi:RNA polymerase sigma factor (sigma-70 family)